MMITNIRQSTYHVTKHALTALYAAHRIIGTQVPDQNVLVGRPGTGLSRHHMWHERQPLRLDFGLNDRRVYEPMFYRVHPAGPRGPWLARQVGDFAQAVADTLLAPFIAAAVGYALCLGGRAGVREVLEHQGLGVCLARGAVFGCMVGAFGVSRW